MPEVILKVGGRNYQGWESVQIKRGLSTLAGIFSLKVSNPWVPNTSNWPIKVGASCEILLENEEVITGYIDAMRSSFTESNHEITISGRDKAGDLIDSSVTNIDQLSNTTLFTICSEICKPFGINVINEVNSTDKINLFKIQPSESAFEAMNRIAKMQGVLLVSNGNGDVVITRSGLSRSESSLQQEIDSSNRNNIKSAQVSFDSSGRHNTYKVVSQFGGSFGTLDLSDSLKIEGDATDESIKRYRPLVIIAEAQATSASAQLRAQWEATTRAAKSAQLQVTVDGWQQENGELWKVNELVRVNSDYFSINEDLLITDLSFSQSVQQGTTTSLTLSRQDAFKPEPIKRDILELWKQSLNTSNAS